MRYRKPSIHSVSACELQPSDASIAALYPGIAGSLDTTPLGRGFSSRSARKPATAKSMETTLAVLRFRNRLVIEAGLGVRLRQRRSSPLEKGRPASTAKGTRAAAREHPIKGRRK